MQKFPTSTNQLNWKLTTGKSLTQEAIDVVHSTSTSLAPMQGSQLMNTSSTPLPPSLTTFTKVAEDSEHFVICTALGIDCPGKLGLSNDWNEEDDHAKDKDKNNLKPALIYSLCQPRPRSYPNPI